MVEKNQCFHCGINIKNDTEIVFNQKLFCCIGCKTVFEIFSLNDLTCYYDFHQNPGITPRDIIGKYDYLENLEIQDQLLEFKENDNYMVSLYIPNIHCSSCIWLLENLSKLNSSIKASQVNFNKKTVKIHYNPEKTNLKSIAYLLGNIGYEPLISLENYNAGTQSEDRSLIYKIGIAFFCFGNIMLLSFPEYFEINEFWIDKYKYFFRYLMMFLALPAFLYSANTYYISAYKSIKSGYLNIDIPIALGIIVMFIRSCVDIFFDFGPGFFDSMTGLIFFMLLGKMFQQKTYEFLSFERDFKSYFPIAVTKIEVNKNEISIPVYQVAKGDRLLIRNQELIPVDGILISKNATIDYSFVTGEAIPIEKKSGDKIFAGGKLIGNLIEIDVLSSVSNSYITQLWSNDVFNKENTQKHKTITDKISKYFTPILLIIAFISLIIWLLIDGYIAFNVFTAILIVACPCALALTAPFTLGNAIRILGYQKFYLKNTTVIEKLNQIDTIVFDKTGTITTNLNQEIIIEGNFSKPELQYIKSIVKTSNHPLSRKIYQFIQENEIDGITNIEEFLGNGIKGTYQENEIRIGSASFLNLKIKEFTNKTQVLVTINGRYKGKFIFENQYRIGVSTLFLELSKKYKLYILSGDNEGEKEKLETILPQNTTLIFNKKPDEKLEYIKNLQNQNHNILMIGDGLNDAGALAQSNVGIAISENINVFSPACDAILDASQFQQLNNYLKYAQKAIFTIYLSFFISLIYNVIGLTFAILGKLEPIIAAIIMPLSTITIVSFVTVMTNYYAKRILKKII
ncbi:MAG: heavy metal translocating P-type ATPase [Flavobacterium sp.]|jgi:Cu+-exporting ATPase